MSAVTARRPATISPIREAGTPISLASRYSLRVRARRHLDRLLTQDQGAAVHDLIEWRQILDAYSDQRLVDFLKTAGPRAMRLYQSMPFLAVLSARDIDALYVAMEEPE